MFVSFFDIFVLEMDGDDPDAPCEGRLGSIVLNKRDYRLKKGTKMKFIPKFDFKRENQE